MMPDGVAVRGLDRLRDTVEVQDDDFLAALRDLIARNSYVNPGSNPIDEDVPDAADRVDGFFRRSAVLRDTDRTLAGAGGGLAVDRQLWTSNTTVVRANPPSAPRAEHSGRYATVALCRCTLARLVGCGPRPR
jgi:hypothetical protein